MYEGVLQQQLPGGRVRPSAQRRMPRGGVPCLQLSRVTRLWNWLLTGRE